MADKILVSIIIPTFNNQDYIVETVQSALNQEHVDVEVIVVDDGSTDLTLNRIQEAGLYNKIRYIYQENKGVSAARNNGLNNAIGTYITFLDSDDLLAPRFATELIAEMRTQNRSIAYCDYVNFIDGSNEILSTKHHFRKSGNLFGRILKANIIPTPAIMFQRNILSNDRFDETLTVAEDWEFLIRVFMINEVTFCPMQLVRIRVRRGSLSADRKKMEQFGLKVREKIEALVIQNRSQISKIEVQTFYYCFAKDYLKQGNLDNALLYFFKGNSFWGSPVKTMDFLFKYLVHRYLKNINYS